MSKVEVLKSFEELSEIYGLWLQEPKPDSAIGWYAYKVVDVNFSTLLGAIHKDYTNEEAQVIASGWGYGVVLVDVRKNTYEAKSVEMEAYIRDYKHLIGCVVNLESDDLQIVGSWRCGVQIKDVGDVHILNTLFKDVKFYQSDEDGSLVDYRTYMKTYYPEYKHIWQEQL